jgi:putative hydrolase of the HAD superfamily
VPDARAIVFDLDDTLYPYRAFLRSGFDAVASKLAVERGLAARTVRRVLSEAFQTRRGRELQWLCSTLALPASAVPELATCVREHRPAVRLPVESLRLLVSLRPDWRLGVLTNGSPHIQRRKVAALGLAPLVDAIVFAGACGNGQGKPDMASFRAVLQRLGTTARSTIFVGDDLVADMLGASRIGMRTIHVLARAPQSACSGRWCDAHVRRLARVRPLAERLMREGGLTCTLK